MKTLTAEEIVNWEHIINVDNGMYKFYMNKANTLPLYILNSKGILQEIDLDTNMCKINKDEQEDYTLEEMLEENDFIIIDDDCIFNKDSLEEIGSIPTYYKGTDTIDSYTNFYKINDALYAENPANSDNYYVWEDVEQMVRDNTSAAEVWHYGEDKLKKIYFGDDLKDIITVVVQKDKDIEDSYIIVDSFSLEEKNPAYSFEMLGKTDNGALVYYTINNCNIRITDIPEGYEIDKEILINYLESLKKYNEAEDENNTLEIAEEYPNISMEDVEDVLLFLQDA